MSEPTPEQRAEAFLIHLVKTVGEALGQVAASDPSPKTNAVHDLDAALGEGRDRPVVVSTYEEAWTNMLHEVRQLVGENQRLVTKFEAEGLHAGCNANVDRLEAMVDDLKQQLDTLRRPVDRPSLAKALFATQMKEAYQRGSAGRPVA